MQTEFAPKDINGTVIREGDRVSYPIGYGARTFTVAQLRGVSGTVVRLKGLDAVMYPWVPPQQCEVLESEGRL